MNFHPVIHLKLSVGQLVFPCRGYHGVFVRQSLFISDGVGTLAGHILRVAVRGHCCRDGFRRHLGSIGRFLRSGLSTRDAHPHQSDQGRQQDHYRSDGQGNLTGGRLDSLLNGGGFRCALGLRSHLLRRFRSGFRLFFRRRFLSGFLSGFISGSLCILPVFHFRLLFLGRKVRLRGLGIWLSVVRTAAGTDQAALFQFRLTIFAFVHCFSSFLRSNGRSFPGILPCFGPDCKADHK